MATLPWGESDALSRALQRLGAPPPPTLLSAARGSSGGRSSSSVGSIRAGETGDSSGVGAASSVPGYVGSRPLYRQQDTTTNNAIAVDVVLISDVVYGSNPGVWERLAETLSGLCSAGRGGAAEGVAGTPAAVPPAEAESGQGGPTRSEMPSGLSCAAGRGDAGATGSTAASHPEFSGGTGISTSQGSSAAGGRLPTGESAVGERPPAATGQLAAEYSVGYRPRSCRQQRTVVLQCETRRVEGVLYDLYWEVLRKAGFAWAPLHDRIGCGSRVEGGSEVRAWVIWKEGEFDTTSR